MPTEPAPARLGEIVLADARTLAYAEHGPADGRPVLFLAGAGTGRSMTFGDAELERRGIRLITVDRPGLGASTHDPAKTFASVATDLAELLRRLGVERPRVVANSQGAPFGLALALAGAAAELVLVSPADEVAHPEVRAQLPDHLRQLVDAAAEDPDGVRRHLETFTPGAMFDLVMSNVPDSDRPVYGDARFASRYRLALEEGFAQGAAGYALDTLLAMRAWGLPLERLEVPVAIRFGEDDEVHSPDRGETLARRIPGAERTVVAGVGGSLLWARPEVALD
ncbi:MAG TPA: alpha/beta hydrolase [Agromyces sp.]